MAWSVEAEKYIAKQLAELRVQTLRDAPREHRRRILREAEAITVNGIFGSDHKKDANGNPIEHGIGSPGNMTEHCVQAYIVEQTVRRDVPEPGYEESLKRMREQLAICDARRKAERAKEDADLDALP